MYYLRTFVSLFQNPLLHIFTHFCTFFKITSVIFEKIKKIQKSQKYKKLKNIEKVSGKKCFQKYRKKVWKKSNYFSKLFLSNYGE